MPSKKESEQGRVSSPKFPTAEVSAKAEAIAKITYQRNRSITEIVPPDVTRAKAGRWLDLISPITEWAGLRGDALRFQREQQEFDKKQLLNVWQKLCVRIFW